MSTAIRCSLTTIALWLVCASTAFAQQPRSGKDLYDSACAACHGADGRGAARTLVGFATELPDFTDCSFATPEAEADWFAIAHEGGTVRAFDRRMPAFGDALQDDELLRILDHVRSFCADSRWPRGELNLPRALVTEKAFPENETLFTTSVTTSGGGHASNGLLYERRIGAMAQLEFFVPFVSHESGNGWNNGPGDVAVALKRVLAHSLNAGRILSVSVEATLPTGDEARGLGSGTAAIEPFLAFGQILPGDGFLQAQGGVEATAEGEKEAFWRVALGKTLVQGRFGRSWSPMVEVVAAREWEGGVPTLWDVVPQMQVSLSKRQHILVSAGVRVPVNERSGRSTELLTYFLWDWFDGGLFDGWR